MKADFVTPRQNDHDSHEPNGHLLPLNTPEGREAFYERHFGSIDAHAKLNQLYTGGDATRDEFEDLLQDVAYQAVKDVPEFKENAVRIKNPHINPDEAKKISARQKNLLDEYKRLVILEAGLPTEVAISDIEQGKAKITDILEQAGKRGEITSGEDALKALGILVHNSQTDQDTFAYPEELFPKSVDTKWEIYISSVVAHLRAVRNLEAHLGEQYQVKEADTLRQIAHDTVTRDIHAILGLDSLPEKDWDYDTTRKLIAKMRDNRFPTIETAEAAVTGDAVVKALAQVGILSALAQKPSSLPRASGF